MPGLKDNIEAERDAEHKKFAIEKSLQFFGNKGSGDLKAVTEQFKALYKDIYNFITNKPYDK